MTGYLPITLAITSDGFERMVVSRCADRFASLNGARPRIYTRPPKGAPNNIHPAFYKAWIWDMVPDDVERIMFIDYDMVPVRSLGELPECMFGACIGYSGLLATAAYLPYFRTRTYFNTGLFLAHRKMRPVFEQLKAFASIDPSQTLLGINEQVPLNILAHAVTVPTVLPAEWNYQIAMPIGNKVESPSMVHFSNMGSSRWVLMQQLLDVLEHGFVDLALGQLVNAEA